MGSIFLTTNLWKRGTLLFLVVAGHHAGAQYFQYSQYNFALPRVNPAITGTTRYAALDVISRTQRTGGDFNLTSNFFSLTCPLLNPSTGEPWSGIGVSVLDDRASGIYKTLEASASYAVHVSLSRYQQLSLGVKALYQSSRISLDGLSTGSQYIGDHGFDASLPTGETMADARSHYTTFSTGLYWQQTDRRGVVIGYFGASIFDFNKPQYAFFGSQSQLSSTVVAAGGFQAYRKNEFSVFPEILYTGNNGNRMINAGARLQYDLRNMPNQSEGRVDLLLKYVVGRSGIVGVQLLREKFSFGVSYDFPVFYTNAANLGAVEVGFTLRKLMETRKRKIAKRRQQERQKTVARRIPQQPKPLKDTVTTLAGTPAITAAPATPPAVEVAKNDSSGVAAHAVAGKISREPLVIEKITLRFHFEYNSVDLDDETEAFLDNLKVTLQQDENLKLKIVGHTDNIGPAKFNSRLSLKRAEAVRDYLLRAGIDLRRLTAEGKGMSQPLNGNETAEEQAKNRRVEILLYHD
jgi:type IX secretion system PorP/SprF family membrane protein